MADQTRRALPPDFRMQAEPHKNVAIYVADGACFIFMSEKFRRARLGRREG